MREAVGIRRDDQPPRLQLDAMPRAHSKCGPVLYLWTNDLLSQVSHFTPRAPNILTADEAKAGSIPACPNLVTLSDMVQDTDEKQVHTAILLLPHRTGVHGPMPR